jgi:hypothetical protein
MHFFNQRFFMLVLGFFLAGIVLAAAACALAPSPDMKSLTWLPRFVARWADAEPTFRNFPAFAALAFVATLFFSFWARSASGAAAFYAMFLVSLFSLALSRAVRGFCRAHSPHFHFFVFLFYSFSFFFLVF